MMLPSVNAVGPRSRIGGFFSAVLLGCLASLAIASSATAQARPDSARAPGDTTAAAPDTAGAPAPAPRDTTPPPQLPELPDGAAASFGGQVWVYDRDALLRSAAVTLGELLERIPGVIPVQAGYYVQPSEVSTLAGAGGRVEVYLDGYALDPLSSAAVDLASIALADVRRVRIERRLDVLRVDLYTVSPTDYRSYARIEAGVTEPRGNLFRGQFLAPHFLFGPFAGAVERLDTQGYQRNVPGNETGGWLKWGWIRSRVGIEGELRRNTVERSENVPWTGDFHRTDWTIRARGRLAPGLTGEAYVGGSSVDQPVLDSLLTEPESPIAAGTVGTGASAFLADVDSTTLRLASRQAGVRLGYEHGGLWGLGAFRVRSDDALPRSDLDLSAGARLGRILELDGGIRLEDWSSRQLTSTRLRGRLSPLPGVSLFAEFGGGEQGTQFLRDSTGAPLFTDRTGVRGGAELSVGPLSAGGALVHVRADSVAPFGLPFDRIDRLYPGATLTGVEGFGRLRLWGPFSIEGSGNRWTTAALPLYTPQINWRGALVYDGSPLRSGHLGIYARAEARSRGAMLVPAPTTTDPGGIDVVQAVTGYDLFLSIRILDFRIFLRYEDMLHRRPVFDIPDRFIPGPRLFYGVKWQFFD